MRIPPCRYCLHGFSALLFALSLTAIPGHAEPAVSLFPLRDVRILDGPFARAAEVNQRYLLALDPERLLAPFLREAGLESPARPYGNWESIGLDGHTAGHYLSALALAIGSGGDTADGELQRRLDSMVATLARCQDAAGDGYLGGVPGSRKLWQDIAAGRIDANGFGLNGKWVPWYNLHKTFAGLRDAWEFTQHAEARRMLIRYGDWCLRLISGLDDAQMQNMLRAEHGGMNEVLADIHAITGERKYLDAARRFNHRAVLDPLTRGEDRLTGMHANTQIPKVTGMQRIALLTGDAPLQDGARFFWDNLTTKRSVAFGGNSVSEHFNNPADFKGMLEHREGPETCNTYNMLRLTELLFCARPDGRYADYYERALHNHILASIHPKIPGYVYFTPIRPQHYRVYSQPEQCFWCCVGTGLENPGKYGRFIYAKGADGIHVNLFVPSSLRVTDAISLVQETRFPFEESSRLKLRLARPVTFTLHLRHPMWVAAGAFAVGVNGQTAEVPSQPGSYAALRREWRDGDVVELSLPMRTTVERLPDGSDWVAFLRGPIVLAAPSGTKDLAGLRANDGRMGQVASGPLVPLDEVPVLLAAAGDLPGHIQPDAAAGPLHFVIPQKVVSGADGDVPLIPFFALHDARYQMYWRITTPDQLAAQREAGAARERELAARDAATLDKVVAGQQQPEVEHGFKGEETETGTHEGRSWRHGKWFQYSLNPNGEKAADLEVTYWGGDTGRTFDILANGTLLATQALDGKQPGRFFRVRYPIPAALLQTPDARLDIRFVAKRWLAGGVYEVRLMKPQAAR